MWKTKNYSKLRSLVNDRGGGGFKSLKKIFCTKVRDKQLNDKYSDKFHWLVLQI